MATEHQHEQRERRDTLRNDATRLREQGSTFSQFAQSDADTPRGRFTEREQATVIGVSPPSYPQLPSSSPWSGVGPQVPDEPPLGLDVNALEPTGTAPEIARSLNSELEPMVPPLAAQGTDGPADASPKDLGRVLSAPGRLSSARRRR